MPRVRADDIDLLVPSFQAPVRAIIAAMVELGFEAIPFDTLRTAEEALRNARRGTGIVDSIHMWGVACDLICGAHLWDCRRQKCKFYTKLGPLAEAHGLVWGGRWPKADQPHVQAIEVREQAVMRALGRGADALSARDALAAASIARRLNSRPAKP